jgi:flagellar hook assembly protein FlgD
VSIEVLAVDGRRVRTLVAGARFGAGTGEVVWDGRDDGGRTLAGGVYVIRFRAGDFTTGRKVQLVK